MWEDDAIQTQSQCSRIPGRDVESAGVTPFRELTAGDHRVFEYYKDVIRKKIREKHAAEFPVDFKFIPNSSANQIENPDNYYFRIDLPHSTVTVKIIPNPHVAHLSEHVKLHEEPLLLHRPSINEITL